MAKKTINDSEGAFDITQEAAAAIVKGQFNDQANKLKINKIIGIFNEMRMELPGFHKHLVMKAAEGTISGGLELEFTARVLHSGILKIQKMAERESQRVE